MIHEHGQGRSHDRWAHLRFSVVGPLLAAPPPPGELKAALTAPWQAPQVASRLVGWTLDAGSAAGRLRCGVWQSEQVAVVRKPSDVA